MAQINRRGRRVLAAMAGALVAGVLAQPAGAAVSSTEKCAAVKLKTAGKYAFNILKCHLKAAKKGDPAPDPLCLTNALAKFDTTSPPGEEKGFTKAELKYGPLGGCANDAKGLGGDTAEVQATAEAYMTDVVAALRPVLTASKCTALKLKVAGKFPFKMINCFQKRVKKQLPVASHPATVADLLADVALATCVAKAEEGYTLLGWDKAELKGDCLTTQAGDGDQDTVRGLAEAFVADMVLVLPPFDGCSNAFTLAPETCDDGNTSNADSCPADCVVDACTPVAGSDRLVGVSFAGSSNVAGLTVLLDYPEGQVSILGSGGTIPAGEITDFPAGSFSQSNDLDHALIQVVADGSGLAMPTGLLFNVHFENCSGAVAPTAGDFACTVLDAGDPASNPVAGVTCSVTVSP